MGRGKQSMNLIKDARTRKLTFGKRKEGLKKKAHELNVLCNVEVCLIVSGPASMDGSTTARELEIWPQNRNQVQHLIDSYMSQSKDDQNKRTENLTSFFEKKCQNIKSDLSNFRKTNEIMAQYPAWDKRYDNFSYEQLREVGTYLESKIADARKRIDETVKATQNYPSSSTAFTNEYADARKRIETMKATQNCPSSSTAFANDFVVPQPQLVSSSSNPSAFPVNYYPFHQNQQGQGSIQHAEHQYMFSHPLMMIPPQLNNSDYYSNNQFGGMCSNYSPRIMGGFPHFNFSTPPIGYVSNNNQETKMMMAPYMQQVKTKTEEIPAWYGQMMQSLNQNQV